ncbi:hypothetical membrane protein [Campylobacter iguaniorum]|uniref:Hypothetical membrane protein n=1 Tax=Campylobacter iguaniorum TaxID=1244531 RepID=A0A076FDM3_9BACT|nr:hypothetical protein [Campylobacter iguaniorum]AII15492.1 hypothetical membrane protein [Campylobacter iguaniorum]
MLVLVKTLIFLATLAYPFFVVLNLGFLSGVLLLLAILWGVRAWLENRIFYLFSLFFVVVYFLNDLKFLYPVAVNLAFLGIFLYSLKDEAIITKFARLKQKDLPIKAINYTRNLTKIWIVFFALNAGICLALAFINEHIWMIYCGFVSYLLVGVLLVGEIIYRKIFVR